MNSFAQNGFAFPKDLNSYEKRKNFSNEAAIQDYFRFSDHHFSCRILKIRQGKRYPLAFDLKLQYDKILKSNFFGFGNNSRDNEYQLPKEFAKLELMLGHAFTERIIGELGYRFTHYSVCVILS